MEVLSGADNLQLISAKEACSKFLEENLTAGTVCTVLSACHHIMGLEALKLRAMIFLCTHAEAALEDEHVVELPKEVVVELLAGDDLDADEEVIFKALVRWGEHNKDANSTVGDALQSMIPLLRLEAMEMNFLKDTVRPSGFVTAERLTDALFDLLDNEKKGRKRDRDSAEDENSLESEGVQPKERKRRRTGGRNIVLAGQEVGEVKHNLMGAYAPMDGKIVNGKGVWKREGMGVDAYMFYSIVASQESWHVGIGKDEMEAGKCTGDLSVVGDTMTPDAATAQWQEWHEEDGEEDSSSPAFHTSDWQEAPNITTRICTEYERQAMVRQAEEEAVAKAKEARIIVLAGQEAGEVQHNLMGAYVLMEGKMVGGRCVWKREGVGMMEAYMFYVTSQGWWDVGIGKQEMEAGECAGYLSVDSDTLTPDAATAQWRACEEDGDWQDAPKITTRICTEYERQAMVRQAEEEAVAKAKEARIIVLAGQEAGEVQHNLMGVYVLMEGKMVGGRCVWKREGVGMEAYMYYAASHGEWFVGGDKAAMEAGRAGGVKGNLAVTSDAMTPDAAAEKWAALPACPVQHDIWAKEEERKWREAPKVTTRICTEHERQAMVRQAEEEAVAKAKEARIIVLAGQEAGEVQYSLMGVYVLMEGKIVGGRCVWKREGVGMEAGDREPTAQTEAYMYYVASDGQWVVDFEKEDMEAGGGGGDGVLGR
jgi:microsomal dipeptidase-like Zn-dependent dipeptidase